MSRDSSTTQSTLHRTVAARWTKCTLGDGEASGRKSAPSFASRIAWASGWRRRGHLQRWNAIRAPIRPMPGSLPSSSIRRWTVGCTSSMPWGGFAVSRRRRRESDRERLRQQSIGVSTARAAVGKLVGVDRLVVGRHEADVSRSRRGRLAASRSPRTWRPAWQRGVRRRATSEQDDRNRRWRPRRSRS